MLRHPLKACLVISSGAPGKARPRGMWGTKLYQHVSYRVEQSGELVVEIIVKLAQTGSRFRRTSVASRIGLAPRSLQRATAPYVVGFSNHSVKLAKWTFVNGWASLTVTEVLAGHPHRGGTIA